MGREARSDALPFFFRLAPRYRLRKTRGNGMRALLFIGAAAAAFAIAAPGHAAERVKIDSGPLQGVTAEGVTSFKGVPFAKPPVGPLRWRPPQAPTPWTDLRLADKQGAICMQKLSKDNGVGPPPASEDCLTLNVFTPTAAAAGSKLPVMVWIHGGGLVNGSGTAALYDGSALARQGVVVVSINYRLGRFGYFAHPALTAESKGEPTANYGLMDQIAALKWVQANAKAFGGDPSNVTIFGESAGGVSVNRLMLAPGLKGLFHKAISESGAGREAYKPLADAEKDGVAFAARLGAATGDAASIRAISADAILAAGDLNMLQAETLVLDGKLVTQPTVAGFQRGQALRIPYLVGSNDREIPTPYTGGASSFSGAVRLTPEQTAAVTAAYGSEEAFKAHVITDIVFGEPARTLAAAQAKAGAATYLYRFSVLSEGAPKALKGAVHASDRQYVFQTLNASPWPTDARDAALAKTISAYWVAFAKTGDPNGPDPKNSGRPAWPRYDTSDRLIEFTNAGPVIEPTPDAKPLDALAAAAK